MMRIAATKRHASVRAAMLPVHGAKLLRRAAMLPVLTAMLLALALAVPSGSLAWAAEDEQSSSSTQRSGSSSSSVMPEDTSTSSTVLDVSISDLESADTYLDGQLVQIVGEVVGDRIYAESGSSHCWLTIEARDSSDAEVAVFIDTDAADVIDTYGNYEQTGTIVQLQGTFNLACPDHEGLSDLHVDDIKVIAEGEARTEEANFSLAIPSIVLIVIGLCLIIVFYFMRERRR